MLSPAALAALCAAAVFAAPAVAVPGYYPAGPRTEVPKSQLEGWQLCFSGLYNQTASLATVLAACDGSHLMLAAGPTGGSTLTVLAAAPRADVIFDTGTGNTPHDANGSGWYYNGSFSWGFAKQGDPIDRSPCDTQSTNPELRLCWHTSGGQLTGGWRAGANTGLNSSTAFTRYIYQPALTTATATPASVDFGAHPQKTLSGAQVVTLANTGTEALSISSMQFSGANAGDFIVGNTDCFRPVVGGGDCRVDLRFSPQGAGARSATLTVNGNMASPTVIALSGTGEALPTGPQGAPGPQGAAGPQGTQGPAGADGKPGRDAKVTCRVRNRRKRKVRVTCKVVFAVPARARVSLRRNGTVVARGRRAGTRSVALQIGRLRKGRYTLYIRSRGVTSLYPVTLR
jgi:hypothetical protein